MSTRIERLAQEFQVNTTKQMFSGDADPYAGTPRFSWAAGYQTAVNDLRTYSLEKQWAWRLNLLADWLEREE